MNNCEKKQTFCIPKCDKEDTYLLDLIRELQTKLDLLEQYYKNLSLSDLTDVRDCLAPETTDVLTYDGELWDAATGLPCSVSIELILHSGTEIARITIGDNTTTIYCKDETIVEVIPANITGEKYKVALIKVNGVTKTLYGKGYDEAISNIENSITNIYDLINQYHSTDVEVVPLYDLGTSVATITVDGTTQTIKVPETTTVSVTLRLSSGTNIADITVNGVTTKLYSPSGTGTLDNIEVNNIRGTVLNKIASLTVTGADIYITGYEESEEVNNDLDLEETDTVNESFGKLAKALKDDEKVVTAAFHAVKESTGFDTNLHYILELNDPIIGQAESLQDADRLIKDFLLNLIEHVSNITDKQSIKFTGGVSKTFKMTDTNSYGQGYEHEVKFPLFAVINVTNNYPIHDYVGSSAPNYYSLSIVQDLIDNPNDVQFILGGIYTWEVSAGVWELWLFVGTQHTAVAWKDDNNWIKRW